MDVIASSYAGWSVLLVLGVPFCIIVLNELGDRLRRRSSVYVSTLEFSRDIVLPALVLLVVLRLVFAVDEQNLPTKIVSTFFWMVLIVAIFRLSQAIFGDGDYAPTDWRSKIPALFLRLPTYTIIGIIIYHVVQNLWALPIREMATTLGIGSIVIAFALQDTLSNLVSGLLLVANSPFKPGDWIKVGDIEGKILTVSWRYTDIETWNGDLMVIPNGSISSESIENFSRPTTQTTLAGSVEIDFNTPPNEVKRVMLRTMGKTPGILADPEPFVALSKLQNPAIIYEFEFWIDDYENKFEIMEDFLTRLWYAARRNNISIPIPGQDYYTHQGNPFKVDTRSNPAEIGAVLDRLQTFAQLPDDLRRMICEDGLIKHFAATERILDIGEAEEGIFIIARGAVTLEFIGTDGVLQVLEHLKPGAIFGETGLFHRAISAINATSNSDTDILVVPHATFNQILNADAKLSAEIGALVNRRSLARKHQELGPVVAADAVLPPAMSQPPEFSKTKEAQNVD